MAIDCPDYPISTTEIVHEKKYHVQSKSEPTYILIDNGIKEKIKVGLLDTNELVGATFSTISYCTMPWQKIDEVEESSEYSQNYDIEVNFPSPRAIKLKANVKLVSAPKLEI